MSILLGFACGINLFLFVMAIVNSLTMVRPPRVGSSHLTFSLLVPCRNEEENVFALVESLAALDHPRYEVIFINDNSTDNTRELLVEATKSLPGMLVIDAEPLPQGWLGKPWALSQGLIQAKSDFIVTVDADVRLSRDALSAMDAVLTHTQADFLSPYPAQIALTLSERLIQPLAVDMDDNSSATSSDEKLTSIFSGGKWPILLYQKKCSRYIRIFRIN